MAAQKHILAGDIGGTKTLLALYAREADGRLREIRRTRYVSREYPSLLPMLREFIAETGASKPDAPDVCACTLGIAGPVEGTICRATNLPWVVDAEALAKALGIHHVTLINDFEAAAIGVCSLEDGDLDVLQAGQVDAKGPMALLGAGTGLGEAIVLRHADRPLVIASEGGHSDFAPRSGVEIGLLEFLLERHARVSVERVVSGQGLKNIYDYLVARDLVQPLDSTRHALEHQDAGAVIGSAAMAGQDPACLRAVELFVAAYGAEAGNLALKCLPTGGVYIAGGIAIRLLRLLKEGEFIRAFSHKGRMSPLLQRMRVAVVLNPDLGLLGARDHAAADWLALTA